jgi:PAS domain-containing protein
LPGQGDTAADNTYATRPLMMGRRLATAEFVPLAIDLARALEEWHRLRGPHAALCPDAIRVGGSGHLRIEARPTGPTSAIYAAPEQTGRLERGVDERTDLYALGIVYYQLLSGRPPFEAVTPAQWRRRHLSEPPRPLAGLVTPLPPALGEIIALLLSKSPDDRYQTARGLAADLERCRDALAAGDAATPLLLRTRDLPDRLAFSGRLYGRDRKLGRLAAAYDRLASGGPAELMAVTAEPGLGRWATVTDFADSVVTGGGRTLRAVCAHDDARPYAALTRLLTDLADQLADATSEHRARIADAVGACGATLAELVPALRIVFGERPPPDGSVAAARHRIQLATRRLLGAVAAPGQPLVVAIRDVQWADEATIELLRYVLAAPDAPAVLAVVTYRTADVAPGHQLRSLLGDERVSSTSLPLRPLPDTALAEVLAEALGAGKRDSSRLSRAVASRTGSNPLLVRHFLYGLADRNLVEYAASGALWQLQQFRIDEEPPAADLTALVRERLTRLAAGTRDVLQLAAVLGPRFDAATLGAIAPGSDVATLLRPAVRAELVTAGAAPGEYRWRHEQLRQAVLAGVADRRLTELRLAVGRTLAPNPEMLFDAVTHLNAAAGLLSLPDERRWLVELNLDAGARAVRVGALADARGYFESGLVLLGSDAWGRWPDLALRLHIASACAERAAGRLQAAERLVEAAEQHVSDVTDRARLLGIRALLRHDADDSTGALRIGIEALQLLGLRIPVDPARWREDGIEAAERLRQQVDDDVLDKLTDAPGCADPRVVIATDLIADLAQPIWPDRSGGDLLVTAGVELAVEHGPTPATAFILGRLAVVFAERRQDRDASRFAGAGLRLLARPGARHSAVTRAAAAVLCPLWLDGPTPMIRELYAAYRTAVEEGEVVLAQRIGAVYSVHLFAVGTPLDQVAADIEARWRFAQRHGGDHPAGAVTRLLEDAVTRLRRLPCDSPTPTAEEIATKQRILRGEYRYYSVVGLSPLLAPAHVLDDNGDLERLSEVIGQIVARAPSTFLTAETAFWHAFSLVQRYENADPDQRKSLRAQLDTLQDSLDDLAARGPGLLRARALLLSAERARLAGAAEQARARYDRAITAARESDFVRSEAFAAERGGRHALARGEVGDAVAYLRRARACYQQWGAVAKLDQLDELLATASRPAGTTRALDQLDLLTVVQAFQAVSGELRLDRLVGVLLELLVSHSQAERGYLLLADGTSLRPAAQAEVERDVIRVNTHVDGAWRDRLPINVIEYAGRTHQVLAGGPDELRAFASDPYLAAHRPRSVLCAPIVRRDNLLAVLYLEHRRLGAAFSTFYLDLLDILCTQAAIALENASVHARLIEANQILDATFDRMPVGLVLLGPDLTVRRVSPRAVEIMGLPIAPGTPLVELFDVMTPADVAGNAYRYEPGFAAVSDWVEPIDREIVILTPQGGRVRLSTSAIPLRDEAGGLVGVTVLVSRAP